MFCCLIALAKHIADKQRPLAQRAMHAGEISSFGKRVALHILIASVGLYFIVLYCVTPDAKTINFL